MKLKVSFIVVNSLYKVRIRLNCLKMVVMPRILGQEKGYLAITDFPLKKSFYSCNKPKSK